MWMCIEAMKGCSRVLRALIVVSVLCACGDDESLREAGAGATTDAGDAAAPDSGVPEPSVTLPPEGEPWELLSQWGLFRDIAEQAPSARVVPYEVNAALYADGTDKHRFVWIPEDSAIDYHPSRAWAFPMGTVLVKTFSYAQDRGDPDHGQRLLETRLLVRGEDRWIAHTYVYDEAGQEAERTVAGKRIATVFIDDAGEERENLYAVPNTNQCGECHGKDEHIETLGGTTRQWNRAAPDGNGNQIDRLIELGWLRGAEPSAAREQLADPFGAAPIVDRMRAYMDANCGHCHNDDEEAGDDGSGLWLRYALTDPDTAERATLGICKMPQSAGGATCGRTLDVVPGMPEQSVMMCRLESDDPEVRMPPVGRNVPDLRGIELIREWIAQLDGTCE